MKLVLAMVLAGTATAAATPAKLDDLLGAHPAELGPAFAGIVLGATASAKTIADARAAVARATGELRGTVEIDVTGGVVDRAVLHFPRSCPRDAIVRRWGDDNGGGWLDRLHHRRAWLTRTCDLVFNRTDALEAWFASLPFDAIGKPVTAVAPATAKLDHARVRWRVAAPAHEPCAETVCDYELQADVTPDHKIRSLGFVGPMTDGTSFSYVIAKLTDRFGPPTIKPQPSGSDLPSGPSWNWSGPPQITIVYFARAALMVQIGPP